MGTNWTEIVSDLYRRIETKVEEHRQQPASSGVFEISDVVDAVERDLPDDYPSLKLGLATRRDIITSLVKDVLKATS